MPAIISSSITPTPFFIFLSTMFIGKGFTISKNLNNIKEIIIQPKNIYSLKNTNLISQLKEIPYMEEWAKKNFSSFNGNNLFKSVEIVMPSYFSIKCIALWCALPKEYFFKIFFGSE